MCIPKYCSLTFELYIHEINQYEGFVWLFPQGRILVTFMCAVVSSFTLLIFISEEYSIVCVYYHIIPSTAGQLGCLFLLLPAMLLQTFFKNFLKIKLYIFKL